MQEFLSVRLEVIGSSNRKSEVSILNKYGEYNVS